MPQIREKIFHPLEHEINVFYFRPRWMQILLNTRHLRVIFNALIKQHYVYMQDKLFYTVWETLINTTPAEVILKLGVGTLFPYVLRETILPLVYLKIFSHSSICTSDHPLLQQQSHSFYKRSLDWVHQSKPIIITLSIILCICAKWGNFKGAKSQCPLFIKESGVNGGNVTLFTHRLCK